MGSQSYKGCRELSCTLPKAKNRPDVCNEAVRPGRRRNSI
jgi:hypothetical protein